MASMASEIPERDEVGATVGGYELVQRVASDDLCVQYLARVKQGASTRVVLSIGSTPS